MTSIGVQLSVGGADIRQIAETAIAYEEAGVDSVWIGDHLLDYYDPRRSTPECFTTLAAVAQATTSIRLGSLVASALFRNAGLLAKMAASIAQLSMGRFILGLGAGGVKGEHLALGFDFPSRSGRAIRLEETLRILHSFRQGESVVIASGSCEHVWCFPSITSMPLAVGALHPGIGRIAGRYADEVNVIDYAAGPDIEAVLDAATDTAQSVGRVVQRSILVPARGEPLYGGRHPRAGIDRVHALGGIRIIYRLLPPYPSGDRVLAGEA